MMINELCDCAISVLLNFIIYQGCFAEKKTIKHMGIIILDKFSKLLYVKKKNMSNSKDIANTAISENWF